MEISELNYNIQGINPNIPQFGSFTRRQTNGVKIPEIRDSFTKTKTASNDGKFSFLEFGKNVAKGSVEFFTDLGKNIIQHPLISIPALVVAGAMASTPLGFAALTGFGLSAGVFGLGFFALKATFLMSGKKWDELEQEGKNFGKLLTGTALSAVGAVRAVRNIETVSNAGKTSSVFQGLKKAFKYDNNLSWNVMKNGVMAPFRAFKQYILRKPIKSNGLFLNPIKADYQNFVSNLKQPLFTKNEADFLKSANLFDWKFKKPLNAIIGIFTGKSASGG